MNEDISFDVPEQEGIFDDIKKEEDIRVTIIISKKLFGDLSKYKEEKKIKALSPMLAKIIQSWLDKETKGKKK